MCAARVTTAHQRSASLAFRVDDVIKRAYTTKHARHNFAERVFSAGVSEQGVGRLQGRNAMNPYSVARVGNEYVVKVEGRSVLRVNSLRLAAKLISVAEQKAEINHGTADDAPLTIERPACEPVSDAV